MKKFVVKKWKAVKIVDGKKIEVEESIVDVITTVIRLGKNSICSGIDNFRIMNKISIALKESEKTEKIELEDSHYKFIVIMIIKYIPYEFGFSPDISKEVESFLSL